jgi:hypothetical protein
MSEKLCFLCEKPLQNNDRINRNSLTLTYMQHQINLRFEKFKSEKGDVSDYHPTLIHITCYDKVKKELDDLCGK